MNTTHTRSIELQPGQGFAVDRHRSGTLVLAEGEVLLHAPAAWLAGTVVWAPPRRVVAPAVLACADLDSITAIGPVKIAMVETASPLVKLQAAWDEVRLAWFRMPWLAPLRKKRTVAGS
jgi:hypothetical protein